MADNSGTPHIGYYHELAKFLTEDRSMYTSLIPKDILHLVLNYVVSRGFIFGGDFNGSSGFGLHKMACVPIEFGPNITDMAFGNEYSILLIDGELFFAGAQTPLGITDEESKLISRLYPDTGFFHDVDTAATTIRYRFIKISKLKFKRMTDEKIIKIVTGYHHSLILTDKQNCYSFGLNDQGQLGIGNLNKSTTWNLIGENIVDIACGEEHSCYLTSTGKIYTFGANESGQLGLGDSSQRAVPTLVSGFSNITKIFASNHNTAFITEINGQSLTYVFGRNFDNQLAIFPPIDFLISPTILLDEFDQPLIDVQKISFDRDTILVLANNTLYVCGSNYSGQLGLGDIKHIDRLTIHPDFLGRHVTDIAIYARASLVVADKICYSTGVSEVCRLGLGHQKNIRKYTRLPLFTETFVKSIQSVNVRIGKHLSGLIII